ncbi:MAG: hypothetical protein HY539_03385 [Deltaproteobacteria bacterium]|nr:hypothetical protein [Deltaproteobacteria bacterium]
MRSDLPIKQETGQRISNLVSLGAGAISAIHLSRMLSLDSFVGSPPSTGGWLTKLPATKRFWFGSLAGMLTGAAVGGFGSAALTLLAEAGAAGLADDYQVDYDQIKITAIQGMILGGGGGLLGGVFFFSDVRKGVLNKFRELTLNAVHAVRSPQYWQNYLQIGLYSGATRLGYDLCDMALKKEEKQNNEIVENALLAFFLGGFCGGLPTSHLAGKSGLSKSVLTKVARYHYIGLDILGDFSHEYLANIRESLGDQKGIGASLAMILVVNVVGIRLLYGFEKNLSVIRRAAVLMLFFDVILEGYYQNRSGRKWTEIDTGRVVGANVWGYMGLIMPWIILGDLPRKPGVANIAARTVELVLKYGIFIGPAMNNLSSRMNGQNWENCQKAHELRYLTLMWPSQAVQSALGSTHWASVVADYIFSVGGSAVVNELFPVYEGVPEIWQKKLSVKIEAIDHAPPDNKEKAFQGLTQFLTRDIGRFNPEAWEYVPSPLNIEKIKQMWAKSDRHHAALIEYRAYLRRKEERTGQEEKILELLKDSAQ